MANSFGALAEQGVFHKEIAGFIPRPAQQEMAQAVEEAIIYRGSLIAESGTGTGKTFAYLVPLVLSGKKAIISTATRHLQEQVFLRDLPIVKRVLQSHVNAALLKGRSNYLCLYRLKQQTLQCELIGRPNTLSVAEIAEWASQTATGDTSEMSGIGERSPIWKQVTSTADNCLGRKCPDFGRCFVNRARQQAMKADLVVVNHHLFFSDLTLKTDGFGELLPDHDVVVFDEAHSVAETAAVFFGFSVSNHQLKELAKDVLSAEKEEKSAVDFSASIPRLDVLADQLHQRLSALKLPSIEFSMLQNKSFEEVLNELEVCLDLLEQALSRAAIAGEGLNRCHDRCLDIQNKLDQWRQHSEKRFIRWAEVSGKYLRLVVTPLSIRERFSALMEANKISWIFTSATLAVGDDFSAFKDDLGLSEVDEKQWNSPYDFRRNGLLYLPDGIPDPNSPGFCESLVEQILLLTEISRGRAFCLFTSHALMEKTRARLKGEISFPLLVQGEAPKQQLLNRFVTRDNAVLLGTASFWEGVDVKGQALSCVIIDKLPFASPSDPVMKSKLRDYEERGKNPFVDVQIPAAVIALKQGIGRLIRSEHDCGVLAICDSRVMTKSYGRQFLSSLPPIPLTRSLSDVRAFFRRINA